MAEKQDMPMNGFKIASDAPYVYAEASDGSQVKISKANLLLAMGISPKNIRKEIRLSPGEVFDFGVIGGLIIINTTTISEQCAALFSCYGESVVFLSEASAFIKGNRETTTANKLVLFREDSTKSCFIKNTWPTAVFRIAYQVIGGFW